MSIKFLLLLVFLASNIFGQFPFEASIRVSGEVHGANIGTIHNLFVELYSLQSHSAVARTTMDLNGGFHFDGIQAGDYSVRVVTGPGSEPLVEQLGQFGQFSGPVSLDLPANPVTRPPSGTVSLRELQHPIPKKAVQAFIESQKYSEAHDTASAVAKLEEAIRRAPQFREAHINLGVRYAREARYQEALSELHTALEIGPAEAMIYANLAWVHAALQQRAEAEDFARKALAMEPGNMSAQYLLQHTLAH